MKQTLLLCLLLSVSYLSTKAEDSDTTVFKLSELEKQLNYETGKIVLESGNAILNVPAGFKYLNRKQSIYVLSDLWGNPVDSSILGMLFPSDKGALGDDSWAFTISFDGMGFVKDDDAAKMDYDDLLKEQQKETRDANPERERLGYPAIDFIGWASTPYYDKDKKILHWAKELKFGNDSLNTLNYNLRILGRKGIFILNAIATMRELPEVKANINKVIGCVEYTDGNKYADFDPKIDEVAAWTVGGLVAGKILAKFGFFAIILKFWKVIALAVAGFGGSIWRFITGRKKEDEIKIEEEVNPNL